ncbi:MAG: metallophosphoesterase, partial [Oscillospiraceae bacterium]|nr:metallophosphoesterase [Oscillospiraceae bacterium]
MKRLCYLLLLCLLLVGCSAKQPSTAVCDGSHIDKANDGFCDNCSKFLLVMVDFYNLNDIHGKLDDADTHPGLDELSTYLADVKQTDDHTVLLSSGDMWQGSAESNLTKGLIMTDWMNQMGFSAMAMGNHEYDWGEAPIEENDKQAQFPFLAINIYDRETDQQVSYCESSVIVDLG